MPLSLIIGVYTTSSSSHQRFRLHSLIMRGKSFREECTKVDSRHRICLLLRADTSESAKPIPICKREKPQILLWLWAGTVLKRVFKVFCPIGERDEFGSVFKGELEGPPLTPTIPWMLQSKAEAFVHQIYNPDLLTA